MLAEIGLEMCKRTTREFKVSRQGQRLKRRGGGLLVYAQSRSTGGGGQMGCRPVDCRPFLDRLRV